jgi:thiamine-monophosphate kinase
MPDDPGESSVIAALLSGRPHGSGPPPRLDAGDDVAILADGTAVGTDLMVEGVHWDARSSAEDVGWKLVAVNASDLGATGATPAWATLNLALPRPVDAAWVGGFARGLHDALGAWGVRLIGGDTTRSAGPRFAGLTMGGPAPRPVTRAGARPGDQLWVTGTLGDAAHGFHHDGPGLAWLRRPAPPVRFGVALADAGLATAMLDLSDGLARDLGRLCAASGCGARVDADALPASDAVAAAPDRLALQTAFGDDYQLLFATAPDAGPAVRALAARHGVQVTWVGACTAHGPAVLAGEAWPAPTFSHFGRRA